VAVPAFWPGRRRRRGRHLPQPHQRRVDHRRHWRFDLGGAPGYFITPFALLQGSVATQNGLTETGAQSLNLSVAQQTTSSLRTIFGAQLGASMDVGLRDRIVAQLRFGWSHEYSDTARPVTASFAGAPAVSAWRRGVGQISSIGACVLKAFRNNPAGRR
jgi:outer membrane autotransporter protein